MSNPHPSRWWGASLRARRLSQEGARLRSRSRAERRALPRVLRGLPLILLICLASRPALLASETPVYNFETNIVYGLVAGKELTLNAFLPAGQTSSVPAIVDIHGGWWFGGGKAARIEHIGGWQWF